MAKWHAGGTECNLCPSEAMWGGLCQRCSKLPRPITVESLAERVRQLENALDRDKTGLAEALSKVVEEVKGRRWICEGRGSYTYNDDRYRFEAGWAFDAIEKIAKEALATSGKLAGETLKATT